MRLFVAIPMPESVTEQVGEVQEPIEGVRWQKEQKLHLTLKFLGNTETQRAREIQQALDAISISSFSITIDGLGYFPKGKKPRVLWAGIQKNEPLQKLHEAVESRCTDLGFDPEQRSFKPHVTIGRIKGASRSEVEDFIDQHKNFHISDVPVEEFVLFESKLHPEGAKHFRKKTYNLSESV